jgi:antitoxin (DNA-binding transcriptional repressor) of toxin-antitoxin stability system
MSTLTINIQEAQNQWQRLLSLALGGAEIIFTQDDKPVARLAPVAEEETVPTSTKKRVSGLHRGQIWVSDDFDDPWVLEPEAKAKTDL